MQVTAIVTANCLLQTAHPLNYLPRATGMVFGLPMLLTVKCDEAVTFCPLGATIMA